MILIALALLGCNPDPDLDGDGVPASVDCDDTDAQVGPPPHWYLDEDSDGWGGEQSTRACEQPTGHVDRTGDCVDVDPRVYPGHDEVCGDGVDNDCDGLADDASAVDALDWYADADGDGFGDPEETQRACEPPSGSVSDDTDCDDTDPAVHPEAPEVCNGDVDDDCDGLADGADPDTPLPTWYWDADEDGWGDQPAQACVAPPNHVDQDGDCDDTDAAVNPGAEEICSNGIDDDCDGGAGGCALSAELDLSSESDGALEGDGLGSLVVDAGDVDGDGLHDLLLTGEGEGVDTAVYLVLGGWSGSEDVDGAVGVDLGARITGLAGDGDANGDGLPEVLVGSADGGTGGRAWLFTDLASGQPAHVFSCVEGCTGLGRAVALGDLDGDGLADAALSDPEAGAVHLFFGLDSAESALDASEADLSFTGDDVGFSLATGDTDGDGIDDLLVGAPPGAWLYLGESASVSTALHAVAMGLSGSGDTEGWSVDVGGDADGDGYGDLLVGDPFHRIAGWESGAIWLVSGPLTADVDLEDADATLLGGGVDDDWAGMSVSFVPDTDGDEVDEVLLGSPGLEQDGERYAGRAALFLGGLGSGTHLVEDADTLLEGEGFWSSAGQAVTGLGDASGDGLGDLVVGVPGQETIYLILGIGL